MSRSIVPPDADGAEPGYSYASQETEVTYHSAAVPLRKFGGTVVAAFHPGHRIERVSTEKMVDEFREYLTEATTRLRPLLI